MFIIMAIVAVVVFGITVFSWHKDMESLLGGIGIGALFGALSAVLTMIIFMIPVSLMTPHHRETVSTHNIVNIKDDSSTSGSFFLFAGSIDDEAVFRFYEDNNGRYKLVTVEAYYVTIVEDDSQPRVISRANFSDWQWLYWPFSEKEVDSNGRHMRFTIHVPKGSIKQEFHLGE